jgi:hypothetical protein
MNTIAPSRPWPRLAALACATVLATFLAASVCLQRQTRAPARSADEALDARLNAALVRAIDQAYVDHDLELAESLERIRDLRARADTGT